MPGVLAFCVFVAIPLAALFVVLAIFISYQMEQRAGRGVQPANGAWSTMDMRLMGRERYEGDNIEMDVFRR